MNTIMGMIAVASLLFSGLPASKARQQPVLETGTVVEYHCMDFSTKMSLARYQCGLGLDAGVSTLDLVGRSNNYPFILHTHDIVRFYRDKKSVVLVDESGISHLFELTMETPKGSVITVLKQ